MEIVINGPRKAARRFVQLQARCKQKRNREKKKIPFSDRNQKTLESKGTSPSGKSHKQVCTHFQKEQCQNKSTREHWHPPECSHGSRGGTCAFKHTGKSGGEKMVKEQLPLHETKELNCVSNAGHTTKFSERSILRKIEGPPSKKQLGVRYCRNAE